MNTYDIQYKAAKGSVQMVRVSANSACQAVLDFLKDNDLPVLSATRADLLPPKETDDMKMKLYRVTGLSYSHLIFANCGGDAKDLYKEIYNENAVNVTFIREAVPSEIDAVASGAQHPKH